MSNPTEDDWKRMTKLVDSFYNRADAEPFRAPVDWKAYGLTDYPQIIKHPMDLGTVRTRLKKGNHYKTLYQVAEDVRLIWSNSMTYNADGSDFYKLADSLQKRWDKQYTALLQDCNSGGGGGTAAAAAAPAAAPAAAAAAKDASAAAAAGADGPAAVTSGAAGAPAAAATGGGKVNLNDKKQLAKLFYQISKEDLGKALVEIEQKCPAALVRNATEDEVEVNLDQLTSSLVQELTNFCHRCSKRKTTGGGATGGSSNNSTSAGGGGAAAAAAGAASTNSSSKKVKTSK